MRSPLNTPVLARHTAACLLISIPAYAAAAPAPDAAYPSVTAMAKAVCQGKVKPLALVDAALQRAKHAASLNAFVTLDEAGARAQAQAIAQSRQQRCLPLAGVPIVIKDNIPVAGLPMTGGTPGLADYRPQADAPVVARLREAGAIIIGKTQMHELAFGISGYNAMSQSGGQVGVRNAWDASRSAGGSSSGTGAAVGARVVLAGLGTDTGGSVRVPCAFNGCASLRPTMGRYSQEGILPISHTRDTAGPMARSVADVAALDQLIAGDAQPVSAVPLKGLRLGRVASMMQGLDADTQQVFDRSLARLQAAGVEIVDVSMPKLDDLNNAVSFPVAMFEARSDGQAWLDRYRPGMTLSALAAKIASPDVKGTYEGLVIPGKLPTSDGKLIDSEPIYQAAIQQGRPALIQLYAQTFREHRLDALVFPTVPVVAMPADAESSSLATFMRVIRNTDPGSNAGVPGMQIPAGLGASTGLPVGLELDGPVGSDRRLLGIGLSIEKLLGRLPAKRAAR